MKKIRIIYILIILILIYSECCFAKGLVTTILQDMERRNELGVDLTAKVSLVQQRVRQGVREIEYLYYRKDSNNAFLLVALSPEREKGNGYLRIDNNMWMYRRNTRTFQHLNRSDRIGDTEVNAENFESRRLTEMYKPVMDDNENEIYSEDSLGKIPVYKFEVKAFVKDVSYPTHVYWVRQDNYLPLKQESYSLSGTLMQTSYYLQYTNIREQFIPIKFIVIDNFEEGNKTIGSISGISLKPVEDAIFTKAYLENVNK